MPKGARGEATFDCGGETYTLLYNNRALADAEARTGKGILAIVDEVRGGKLSVRDTADLLVAGLEAARRDQRAPHKPYTPEHAFAILDELGLARVVQVVMSAVADCVGYTAEGDAEAANPPS